MVDWSQIVEQHGPLVWKTVYRLLRHDADAADCFQRTFLSALELSRTQAIHNWPGLLRRLGTARALEARTGLPLVTAKTTWPKHSLLCASVRHTELS